MKRLLALAVLSLTTALAQSNTYVLASPRSAFLLQWTEAGGQLTGSFQSVSIKAGSLPEISVLNGAFTGTRQGANVNLLFRTSVFGVDVGNVLNATLNGNTLTLNLPSATGGFTKVALQRGTLDTFNKATTTVRATLARERSAALAAQERQRAEAERQRRLAAARQQELDAQATRASLLQGLRASVNDVNDLLATVPVVQRDATSATNNFNTALTRFRSEVDTYKRTFAAFKSCSEAADFRDAQYDRLVTLANSARGGTNRNQIDGAYQSVSNLLGDLALARINLDANLEDAQGAYKAAKLTLPADLLTAAGAARPKIEPAIRALQPLEVALNKLRTQNPSTSQGASQVDAIFDSIDWVTLPPNCS